jgi:superfamily II RNA helicase
VKEKIQSKMMRKRKKFTLLPLLFYGRVGRRGQDNQGQVFGVKNPED